MQLIYKNSKVKIEYDNQLNLMILDYFGIYNHQLIQEAYANISANGVHFIIGDLTKIRGSFNKMMDYFEDKYAQLKQGGMVGQALIISDDLIIENLARKLERKILKAGIDVFVTTSKEAAFEWVKTHAHKD